jgi:hypothetical protein
MDFTFYFKKHITNFESMKCHVYNTENTLWRHPIKRRWSDYLQSFESENFNPHCYMSQFQPREPLWIKLTTQKAFGGQRRCERGWCWSWETSNCPVTASMMLPMSKSVNCPSQPWSRTLPSLRYGFILHRKQWLFRQQIHNTYH